MAKLEEPIERRYLFAYMQFLITTNTWTKHSLFWRQGADLAELTAYQPSASNLVANGDFSLNVISSKCRL